MKNRQLIFRFILFVLVLLGLVELVNAQGSSTGIRVGYNSSDVLESTTGNYEHKRLPGIHLGGLYSHSFPVIDLQGELLISTKGYQSGSIGDTYIQNLFLYLEMPILVKKDILSQRYFQLYLIGGNSLLLEILAINLISEIEGIRKFDSAIVLGAGIRFGQVSLESRITQSYLNLDLISPHKFNQTISIGLSFYFKDQ